MGAWLSTFAPATPSPWPALPLELADLILRRLSSHADRARFASVCRQWHHAMAEHFRHTMPWPSTSVTCWFLLEFHASTFPQLRSFPDGKLHYFSFLRKLDYTQSSCLGSFGSWLLFENPSSSRQNTLWNPVTGATMQLPKHCREPERLSPFELNFPGTRSTYFRVRKIIVCSPELIAGIVRYYDHQDLVVCCRPGMSSWSSGLLCENSYRCYQDDMAFYEGRIYAVATSGGDLFAHELVAEDTLEPRVCRLEKVIQGNNNTFDGPPISQRSYLIISCTGKLLMVRRLMCLPHNNGLEQSEKIVRVFEADFERCQWVEVESLGDQVLFVSSNCSRAVSAYDHGSYLKGSTIYFLRDAPAASDRFFNYINPYVDVCGVYDMSSKTICPISLGQLHTGGVLKAAWFFP